MNNNHSFRGKDQLEEQSSESWGREQMQLSTTTTKNIWWIIWKKDNILSLRNLKYSWDVAVVIWGHNKNTRKVTGYPLEMPAKNLQGGKGHVGALWVTVQLSWDLFHILNEEYAEFE